MRGEVPLAHVAHDHRREGQINLFESRPRARVALAPRRRGLLPAACSSLTSRNAGGLALAWLAPVFGRRFIVASIVGNSIVGGSVSRQSCRWRSVVCTVVFSPKCRALRAAGVARVVSSRGVHHRERTPHLRCLGLLIVEPFERAWRAPGCCARCAHAVRRAASRGRRTCPRPSGTRPRAA